MLDGLSLKEASWADIGGELADSALKIAQTSAVARTEVSEDDSCISWQRFFTNVYGRGFLSKNTI